MPRLCCHSCAICTFFFGPTTFQFREPKALSKQSTIQVLETPRKMEPAGLKGKLPFLKVTHTHKLEKKRGGRYRHSPAPFQNFLFLYRQSPPKIGSVHKIIFSPPFKNEGGQTAWNVVGLQSLHPSFHFIFPHIGGIRGGSQVGWW